MPSSSPSAPQSLCQEALRTLADVLEEDHPTMLQGRVLEARYELAEGDAEGALARADGAVGALTRRLGAGHWQVGEGEIVLAQALLALGRTNEAREVAARALRVVEAQRGADNPLAREARRTLAGAGG